MIVSRRLGVDKCSDQSEKFPLVNECISNIFLLSYIKYNKYLFLIKVKQIKLNLSDKNLMKKRCVCVCVCE